MNQLRALRKKYPFPYYLAVILLSIGLGWAMYRLIQISWIIAAILSGILLTLTTDWNKNVRPTFWSIAANIAAFSAYYWVFFEWQQGWWAKCLAMFLLTPVFILANWGLKYDVTQDTRRRNRRAEQIVEKVLSGESVPTFGLYLRPFFTTDKLPGQTVSYGPSSMNQNTGYLDTETIFKRALGRQLDLIGLSRDQDIEEGVARVSVNNMGWQETIQHLMDKAAFIIVVPLSRKGTLWELRELKSRGHLRKTVFLMPELQSEQPNGVVVPVEQDRAWDAGIRVYDSEEHYINFEAEWKLARQTLSREGLLLPPYARCGAMFTISPETWQIKQITPMLLSLLEKREEYIQTVLTEFDLLPGRSRSGRDLLEAFEAATFQSLKNREYVLTLALELFVMLGDIPTASVIYHRIDTIARTRPLLIEYMVTGTEGMIAELEKNNSINWDKIQEGKIYLTNLRNVQGIDTVLVDGAIRAVDEALARQEKRSSLEEP